MINDDEDFLGLEANRLTYARFYTQHVIRRPNQAPTKLETYESLQLPNSSVLHTLEGFDTLTPTDTEGMPNENNPLIHNEKNPIYLKIETQVSDELSRPFGVSENFVYRPNKLAPSVLHYYQRHRKFHRILSDRTIGTMSGVMTWLDYSPLNEMHVMGTLSEYRKFDILFRTILNKVVNIGDAKHHFILLPQGDHVYPRSIIQRTFKELTTSTLNGFKHDPSIYPLLHILGYVYGKTHPLEVTPYKEDVRILGKDNPLFSKLRTSSLLERIDPSLFESINFIIQRGNSAIVYNLADLDRFAEDSSFFTKIYRHFMSLRLSSTYVPEAINTDSDSFDDYVESVSTHPDKEVVNNTPVENTPVITEEKIQAVGKGDVVVTEEKKVEEPVKVSPSVITPIVDTHHEIHVPVSHHSSAYEQRVRSVSIARTNEIIQNEPKKINRRDELLDQHFKVSFGGKSIAEHLEATPPKVVTPKKMDFLNHTPEVSYQKSSLDALDSTYMEHGFYHDLAKVLSSTAKHGMFVTKVDEDRHNTEMDRLITYKVSLTDTDGKAHNVRFTIPEVDNNGIMKLSGVEYRLVRQATNIPICKISPTRVNLASYYNKLIIERATVKRYSYENDIFKHLMRLKIEGLIEATSGNAPSPTKKVPYDYSAIGMNIIDVKVKGYRFYFNGNGAPLDLVDKSILKLIESLGNKYGIYVGDTSQSLLYWDMGNQIHEIDVKGNEIRSWKSFTAFLEDMLGKDGALDKPTIEWTQAHILNQVIPIVFILGYEYGLKTLFDKINLDYKFYENNRDVVLNVDDIAIPFNDGTLVFNRYPVSRSLIVGGLAWVSLKDINFKDMNVPVTYGKVLGLKGISLGVLKGLRGFIDFFVDPITAGVLEKLHEPTTFGNLLLRANIMLSDYYAEESCSVKLHRFRLYERFNGMLYNEMYRELVNHRNNTNTKKGFSINPEAVFQSIVQDATVVTNDAINPIHEVKQKSNFTFTGSGGRSGNSFVLKDRIYPKDGLGVISDAVPDSGKVGITNYLSASPNIDDINGLPKPYKVGDKLEPPQILSIGAMVMPCGTTDDGKRNSYTSIQLSHYVPNSHEGETLAIRTGYDAVLPHLVSDLFAVPATDDGNVISIDDKFKVLKVRYKDTPIETIRDLKLPYLDTILDRYNHDHTGFGFLVPETEIGNYPLGGIFSVTKNTNAKVTDTLKCTSVDAIPDKDVARRQNSLIYDFTKGKYSAIYYVRFMPLAKTTPGPVRSYSYANVYSQISGSHLLQTKEVNVKPNESFKKGDILIYNSGFFTPDPMSKQVTFKHGTLANVAMIEKGSNLEDACEISKDFSKRLKMTPCHQRVVITKRDASVLSIVKLNDHVETSDSLCIISDDYMIESSLTQSVENLDLMEKLNRQTPPADYTGYIRQIRILYGCERDKLTDSLKTILKDYEKEVRHNFVALNNDPKAKPPERPGYVKPGTRYQGVEFTEDTVILEFMIEETIDMYEGDKLVVGLSSKSIVSHVNEKTHYTESGIPIDILFSTTSVINRIVASPLIIGMCERLMDKLKTIVISMWEE
jgi:hypothetical protein